MASPSNITVSHVTEFQLMHEIRCRAETVTIPLMDFARNAFWVGVVKLHKALYLTLVFFKTPARGQE